MYIFEDTDIDVVVDVIVTADDGDDTANYGRGGASLYTSLPPAILHGVYLSCTPSCSITRPSMPKDGQQVRPCRGSSPVRPL